MLGAQLPCSRPCVDGSSDPRARAWASRSSCICCRRNIATIDQQKALVLALAASFQAQGLFINPNNVKFFNVFYQALDLGSSPTGRRLLQVGSSTPCGVRLHVTPPHALPRCAPWC